jgi:methane monooxygenase component A beta chain/propane monooxygenase small subunit
MASAPNPPRDFTYIRPRGRRLSEYEAVTCYLQPDPNAFEREGWFLRTASGRGAWVPNSTRLRHPHWFDFRDPAAQWQRPYVRLQAEQERSIDRLVEEAARSGVLRDIRREWVREVLGIHYRVWSYVEYGLFRAFAWAQREALADTLGNALCFEAVDRMRHAQDIVLYVMDLEETFGELRDDGSARQAWLEDPAYQPLRRLVEEVIASEDWAEVAVVVNLVFDPIVTELAVSQLVRRNAGAHGDVITPAVILTTERDRRRNRQWTEELVRLVTAPDVPSMEANRKCVRGWIEAWLPRAWEAADALRSRWPRGSQVLLSFDQVREQVRSEFERLRRAWPSVFPGGSPS